MFNRSGENTVDPERWNSQKKVNHVRRKQTRTSRGGNEIFYASFVFAVDVTVTCSSLNGDNLELS